MKAVIPAAGLGSRFLPYTKAQPKEMLPLIDTPAIQYVLEEALDSGIRDLVVVIGRGKRAIKEHFRGDPGLNRYLRERGRLNMLGELPRIIRRARVAYVRQPRPLGNGHAILCAQSAVGDEPLAVLLGDDVMLGKPPCTKSLIGLHRKLGASCIAAQVVDTRQVGAYGMIVGEEVGEDLVRISRIVEKPSPREVSSNLVTIGRYVFSPEIFRHLRKASPGKGGEIWLTDAISSLLRNEDVYAWVYRGTRLDVGTKAGWLLANVELALQLPEYRKELRALLRRTPGGARRCRPTSHS